MQGKGLFKSWSLRPFHHLLYWAVLLGLLAGVVYQRIHIEQDHDLCLIEEFGHPEE